jgi:hypothetical protein
VKRLLLVLAVLVLAAVGAVVYFVRYSLDGVVRHAIERSGSEVLGTRVSVRGVHIDLRRGQATISGISVANPPGFSAQPALTLSGITVALDTRSVRSNPIVIESVDVGEPRVLVELTADGRANLDVLRGNVKAYSERAQGGGGATGGGGPGGTGSEKPERRLRVRHFQLEQGNVRVDPSALGRDPVDVPLVSIGLHDLGGARGAPPGAIGQEVADALVSRSLRAAAGGEAKRALGDFGSKLGNKLGDLIEKGLQQ